MRANAIAMRWANMLDAANAERHDNGSSGVRLLGYGASGVDSEHGPGSGGPIVRCGRSNRRVVWWRTGTLNLRPEHKQQLRSLFIPIETAIVGTTW